MVAIIAIESNEYLGYDMCKLPKDKMPLIDWSKTDYHKHVVRFCIVMSTIFIMSVGCQQCNRFFDQDDDWWLEEAVEEVIEAKTGLQLDLSPESHE